MPEVSTECQPPVVRRELVAIAGRPARGEWEYVLWLPIENRTWIAR